jgi:hypothetical protein
VVSLPRVLVAIHFLKLRAGPFPQTLQTVR